MNLMDETRSRRLQLVQLTKPDASQLLISYPRLKDYHGNMVRQMPTKLTTVQFFKGNFLQLEREFKAIFPECQKFSEIFLPYTEKILNYCNFGKGDLLRKVRSIKNGKNYHSARLWMLLYQNFLHFRQCQSFAAHS